MKSALTCYYCFASACQSRGELLEVRDFHEMRAGILAHIEKLEKMDQPAHPLEALEEVYQYAFQSAYPRVLLTNKPLDGVLVGIDDHRRLCSALTGIHGFSRPRYGVKTHSENDIAAQAKRLLEEAVEQLSDNPHGPGLLPFADRAAKLLCEERAKKVLSGAGLEEQGLSL